MYARVDIHNDRHVTQVATYFYYNDPEYENKNKYQKCCNNPETRKTTCINL